MDFSDGRVPVFLLHGRGSSSRDWTFQLPVLEARYRVLAIDLPGHGRLGPSRRSLSGHGMAEDVELSPPSAPSSGSTCAPSLDACAVPSSWWRAMRTVRYRSRPRRELAAGMAGTRLLVARGSGHASHYDAPDTVNAAPLEFLAAT